MTLRTLLFALFLALPFFLWAQDQEKMALKFAKEAIDAKKIDKKGFLNIKSFNSNRSCNLIPILLDNNYQSISESGIYFLFNEKQDKLVHIEVGNVKERLKPEYYKNKVVRYADSKGNFAVYFSEKAALLVSHSTGQYMLFSKDNALLAKIQADSIYDLYWTEPFVEAQKEFAPYYKTYYEQKAKEMATKYKALPSLAAHYESMIDAENPILQTLTPFSIGRVVPGMFMLYEDKKINSAWGNVAYYFNFLDQSIHACLVAKKDLRDNFSRVLPYPHVNMELWAEKAVESNAVVFANHSDVIHITQWMYANNPAFFAEYNKDGVYNNVRFAPFKSISHLPALKERLADYKEKWAAYLETLGASKKMKKISIPSPDFLAIHLEEGKAYAQDLATALLADVDKNSKYADGGLLYKINGEAAYAQNIYENDKKSIVTKGAHFCKVLINGGKVTEVQFSFHERTIYSTPYNDKDVVANFKSFKPIVYQGKTIFYEMVDKPHIRAYFLPNIGFYLQDMRLSEFAICSESGRYDIQTMQMLVSQQQAHYAAYHKEQTLALLQKTTYWTSTPKNIQEWIKTDLLSPYMVAYHQIHEEQYKSHIMLFGRILQGSNLQHSTLTLSETTYGPASAKLWDMTYKNSNGFQGHSSTANTQKVVMKPYVCKDNPNAYKLIYNNDNNTGFSILFIGKQNYYGCQQKDLASNYANMAFNLGQNHDVYAIVQNLATELGGCGSDVPLEAPNAGIIAQQNAASQAQEEKFYKETLKGYREIQARFASEKDEKMREFKIAQAYAPIYRKEFDYVTRAEHARKYGYVLSNITSVAPKEDGEQHVRFYFSPIDRSVYMEINNGWGPYIEYDFEAIEPTLATCAPLHYLELYKNYFSGRYCGFQYKCYNSDGKFMATINLGDKNEQNVAKDRMFMDIRHDEVSVLGGGMLVFFNQSEMSTLLTLTFPRKVEEKFIARKDALQNEYGTKYIKLQGYDNSDKSRQNAMSAAIYLSLEYFPAKYSNRR